jgi:C4-dicarboxylate transporter, DctM subunit
VLYGIITEQPIGKLLIAGILPGLLLTALFIITIYIIATRNRNLYPRGPNTSWKEKGAAIGHSWSVILLFVAVMGGIYLGIYTATEAAAVGVFVAFLIALAKRRLGGNTLVTALMGTLTSTGMIFLIIIGAMIFSIFFARTNVPFLLANLMTSLAIPPWGFMLIIICLLLVLGCVMDSYAVMLLIVPVLIPSVKAMGFDLIWFGVINVIMIELGLITPPVGINVFVIAGAAKDVPLYTVFRGIMPFAFTMLVCVAILIIFPQIALVLTRLSW